MTRLRVLAVTNMYPRPDDPAFGAFVASQMQSVQALGADVRVEIIDGRRRKGDYVRAAFRLRSLAKSGAFDLVHAHYGLTGFLAAFQPLPRVVSYCGDDLLGTPNGRGGLTLKSRVIRRLSRMAAPRADAIICKSAELQMALPCERDRARAHVIPNGVNTSAFSPGPRDKARAELGLDTDVRLILFPSTPTEPRKRLDLAQAAVRILEGEGINVRLWVVTGVSHDKLPAYYRAADCLLLTSDWEGSPNVVKEALCCDVPVVSVDAGDVRRWMDLVPGCHLVSRDPGAIAGGLRRSLLDDQPVDGSAVRAELNLPHIGETVLNIYREAIARRRGPS